MHNTMRLEMEIFEKKYLDVEIIAAIHSMAEIIGKVKDDVL